LQQEAARKLGFATKKTMLIAQQLYEGVDIGQGQEGLITYMRTDSVRVAAEAQAEAREYIVREWGKEYLPEKPPQYKSKKGAQEAHEAIRPTSVFRTPESIKEYLTRDQFLLYQLIWQRFVASQMRPALLDTTAVDILAGRALFRASGSVVRFAGFMRVYTEAQDEDQRKENGEETEAQLPPLEAGLVLALEELLPEQHFTQPPPRFTEASLVKELEEKGLGRPSTYATILSTIQQRGYVEKRKGRFYPTELGKLVNGLLVASFPDILNVEFTARMEDQLDLIEEGKVDWVASLRQFYGPFSSRLEAAELQMRNVKQEAEPTEVACPECGRQMVKRWGRHGRFLACSGYPECRKTLDFVEGEDGSIQVVENQRDTDEVCEKCGSPMVLRRGRYGEFLACANYPACRNTRRPGERLPQPEGPPPECARCGAQMVIRRGRYGAFWACSNYPKCRYVRPMSTGIPCPLEGCDGELVARRSRKGVFYGCSRYPECNFTVSGQPVRRECPECGAGFLVEQKGELVCVREGCGYRLNGTVLDDGVSSATQ